MVLAFLPSHTHIKENQQVWRQVRDVENVRGKPRVLLNVRPMCVTNV